MCDYWLSVRVLCFAGVIGAVAAAAPADERVGFEDSFDTTRGWTRMDIKGEMADLKVIESVDGVARFTTHPAPLGSRQDPKWADGMPLIDAFANIKRTYEQTVDLDRYHYLVVKIDEKSCPASIMLNGAGTPIAFTTGVRAVDLRDHDSPSLHGKQPIWFRFQFLNTGGTLKLDWIRLVSDLSAEERKGLIAPGHALRPEPLAPDTTQGLAEVMRRVGRVRPEAAAIEAGEQMLCMRDTATGAVIWRMTGPTDVATVVSDSIHSVFNASGSHLLVLSRTRGPLLCDPAERTWRPRPFAGISRFSPIDRDILWCIERTTRPAGMRFHKVNIRTGLDEVMGQLEFPAEKISSPVTELGFSEGTEMVAVGLRETPYCFIFDPTKPYAERVRMIELPMRLKGMGLSPDGRRLFFNRCYWYESWEMDLASGKISLAMTGGGSHAGGGAGVRLSHYEGSIVAYPSGYTGGTPGDLARIFLNYRSGWSTDYGHVSADGNWYVANGWGEPMHGRLIVANVNEPGTVLQVGFMNTSRDGWDNNTVVRSSPDATKLAWTSDLWGYNAVCTAFVRQPEPPRNLKARRQGEDVVLSWERAILANDPRGRSPAELAGYHVYRSVGDGPMLAMTRRPVAGLVWRDESAPADAVLRYVAVCAEYSGLEGIPSNEAVVPPAGGGPAAPTRIHQEAELCQLKPPARAAFNGQASGFQHVRIRRTLSREQAGEMSAVITVPTDGQYAVFVRCRAEDKPGIWQVLLDDKPAGQIAVDRRDRWQWLRLDKPMKLSAGASHRLSLASGDEGLCVDKFIVTDDLGHAPSGADDRFAAAPRAVELLTAADVTTSSVRLAWWNPKAESDLDHYNVYAAAGEDCPTDQAHLIASTRSGEVTDWGLAPAQAYTYKVVAVNRRGLASAAVAVSVTTKSVPQRVLIELPVARATLDRRLVRESRGGFAYAFLPDLGEKHQDDPPAEIAWQFDLPVSGTYHVWCMYAPGDLYPTWHRVNVLLDDLQGGKGTWRMRTPYREMAGTNYRNWKTDLWFADRVHLYTWPQAQEQFRLPAGEHKLAILLTPRMREFSHKISRCWVTNDASWRPPGFDPQADFAKSRTPRE